MASGDLVQSAADWTFGNSIDVNGTSARADQDDWAAPTTGNLLIAIGTARTDVATTPSPTFTGWNIVQNHYGTNTSQISGLLAWKVADNSTDGTITLNWHSSDIFSNCGLLVAEFDATGLDLSAPLASGEDASGVGGSSNSIGTGSASSTSSGDLCIAGLSVYIWGSWEGSGTTSIDNSYTIGYKADPTADSNSRVAMMIASKLATSAADQAATWTTTDTGGQRYGSIIIFPAVAAATPGIEVVRVIPGA